MILFFERWFHEPPMNEKDANKKVVKMKPLNVPQFLGVMDLGRKSVKKLVENTTYNDNMGPC